MFDIGTLILAFISWDGKVTAGDMIMGASFLISAFVAWNRLSIKIAQMETKLDQVIQWWQTCSKGDCPMLKQVKEESHHRSEGA